LIDSTLYTRSIANLRANVADPDFMEAEIRKIANLDTKSTKITVIKGSELK